MILVGSVRSILHRRKTIIAEKSTESLDLLTSIMALDLLAERERGERILATFLDNW